MLAGDPDELVALDYYGNQLREAAEKGRLDLVSELVESDKVNLNGQHKVNGWTALHWAAKRSHANVVRFLLDKGADRDVLTKGGQRAADLASDPAVLTLLTGCSSAGTAATSSGGSVEFVPNYLRHPTFPYTDSRKDRMARSNNDTAAAMTTNSEIAHPRTPPHSREIILKARVARAWEKDFVEVDVEPGSTSFDELKRRLCEELGVADQVERVVKLRKLPDTIVRNDKDVRRLKDYQELELVLRAGPDDEEEDGRRRGGGSSSERRS